MVYTDEDKSQKIHHNKMISYWFALYGSVVLSKVCVSSILTLQKGDDNDDILQ